MITVEIAWTKNKNSSKKNSNNDNSYEKEYQ